MKLYCDEIKYISVLNPSKRWIIGISGPPGSGKSTVAKIIMDNVNKLCPNKCVIMPVDGFHKYKKELDQMEDSKEAYRRRGAPFTFNPHLMIQALRQVKQGDKDVQIPSFDHQIGDPIEDDILISKNTKIVLVEGVYLFLQEAPWNEISSYLDEKWFVDVDIDICMKRVCARHVQTGLSLTEAQFRCDYNDKKNGELIATTKQYADRIIKNNFEEKGRKEE